MDASDAIKDLGESCSYSKVLFPSAFSDVLDGTQFLGNRIDVQLAKGGRKADRDDRRPRGDYGDRGGDRDYPSGPRNFDRGSSKYGPPRQTGFRAVVENLNGRTSWQVLYSFGLSDSLVF